MPELPTAVRERSLSALEVADLRLLPALRRALAAVFDAMLTKLAETYISDTITAAQRRDPRNGQYAGDGGHSAVTVKGQEWSLTEHPDVTMIVSTPKPGVEYMRNLRAPESKRGQGLGKQLMEAWTAHADRVGVELVLHTNPDKLVSWYERLGFRVVGEAAFGKEMRRPPKEAKGLTAALSLDDLDSMETQWNEQVDREITPIVNQLFVESARDTFTLLAPGTVEAFNVSEPLVSEFMATARRRITDIGERTWRDMRASLAEGLANGESQADLQQRVREQLLVSRTRAETIARTEARAARNGGAMAGARALGEFAPRYKQWIATLDGRTRHTHAAADGQVVTMEDSFVVGGVYLDYPGDPNGPGEEVINCRCRWIAVEEPDSPIVYKGRQMEVNARVAAEKRGAYKEVLRGARRMGLIAADHPGQRHGKGGKYVAKAPGVPSEPKVVPPKVEAPKPDVAKSGPLTVKEEDLRADRLRAGDPALWDHVGEQVTLIDGWKRWRGQLIEKEVIGLRGPEKALRVLVGQKTLQRVSDRDVVEVTHSPAGSKAADRRYANWKKTGHEEPPPGITAADKPGQKHSTRTGEYTRAYGGSKSAVETGGPAAPSRARAAEKAGPAKARQPARPKPSAEPVQPGKLKSGQDAYGSQAELASTRRTAKAKIRSAPVPSEEAVAKARAELEKVGGRAGGEARGGGSKDRAAQRRNLFKELGGDKKGHCLCHGCGLKLHHTDDPAENPHGLPKLERGKIFIKRQGGGYQLPNLLAECFDCNRGRNNKPLRRENLK